MAGVELAFIAPHPWIMVAGEREEGLHSRTTTAFGQAADEIVSLAPDLLVVTSPHWTPRPRLRIGGAPRYRGTLDRFLPHVNAGLPPEHRRDLPPVPYDFSGEPRMAEQLREAGEEAGLPITFEAEPEVLDHGSMVPIYYLNPNGEIPVLLLSIEEGERERSRTWGEIVGRELTRAGRRAVFVASGTLSHRFEFERPDALWPPGEEWDKRVLDLLSRGDSVAIFSMSEEEMTRGELEDGGLHGLYMLLGAVGGSPKATVLSYEGIFGVGSAIIRFEPEK